MFIDGVTSKRIQIPVVNNSVCEKILRKGETLGTLQEVDVSVGAFTSDFIERTNKNPTEQTTFRVGSSEMISEGLNKSSKPQPLMEKVAAILSAYHEKLNAQSTDKKKLDIEHSIETTDDAPVVDNPRRLPYSIEGKVRHELDRLLENNFIRKSSSNYSSAIVLVIKRDNSVKIAVDCKNARMQEQ